MSHTRPPRFAAVLFDWRGTLVVAPTEAWLVERAFAALGRDLDDHTLADTLARLDAADHAEVDSSAIDTDADRHARAYAEWFAAAGIDPELSTALYEAESDLTANEFAHDAGPVLAALHDAGVRIAVVSDIHRDLRPVFATHTLPDGRSFDQLVDAWALSFELGVAKPDPRIFAAVLDALEVLPGSALMVGDRGAFDGAASNIGIMSLIVPELTAPDRSHLDRVLDLVLVGRGSVRFGRCDEGS